MPYGAEDSEDDARLEEARQAKEGKHARLLADFLLVKHFKRPRLPWGGDTLDHRGHRRDEYIAAIRSADAQGYMPLLKLCQSSV